LRSILFLLLFVMAVTWLSRAARRRFELPALRDPWQVLGVDRGASASDIHSAYRKRMAEYHPDKVQRMGPEIRELAERRAKEINEAYRTLRGPS
jgi:DnaJ like chaperone protein